MDTNNRTYDEVSNILHSLRSLERNKQWVFNCNGEAFEYKDGVIDDLCYLIRIENDGLFIHKGGWRFMLETAVNTVFPTVLRRLKDEAASSVLPDETLRSLEFHVNELSELLSRGSRSSSERLEMNLKTPEICELYEKYAEVPDELEAGLLAEEEVALVLKTADLWMSQIRSLYESVNERKRKNFHEESIFWREFYMRLSCVRELHKSREFKFVHNILKITNRVLTTTTLESLFSSDKYFELGRAFYYFYRDLDFTGVYFPENMNEFRISIMEIIQCISESIRKQPRIIKKSVFIHMEGLVNLLIHRVCSCSLSECLECCEELLSECVKSILLLTDPCDGDSGEIMSLESATLCEFKGANRLSKFYLNFVDVKRLLLFASSFKRLKVLFPVLSAEAEHSLEGISSRRDEYIELLGEIELEVARTEARFRSQGDWSGHEPTNVLLSIGTLLNKHETFISDIFNALFEDIDNVEIPEIEKHSDTGDAVYALSSLTILLRKEEVARFTKLFGIMKMFQQFHESNVFSEKTLANRLKVLEYFNSVFDRSLPSTGSNLCTRIIELFILRDLFEEVSTVFDLFFGSRDNEILQLSEFRRKDNHMKKLILYEISAWCSSIPSVDFLEHKILGVANDAGDGVKKLEVLFNEVLLHKLDEYLLIISSATSEIASSMIPHNIHGMMRSLAEIRLVHNRLSSGCNLFNRIIKTVHGDMGLFCNEIDSVFDSVKKIWNLKWRHATVEDIEGFMATIQELEKKAYAYKFLMKKIAGTEMKMIFSSQIRREVPGFSLDSTSYLKFFEFYDRDIVLCSINNSIRNIFVQYLDSVIHALEANDNGLFISKHRLGIHRIESSGRISLEPPLPEYFKILEKIFPSTSRYFFDCAFEKFRPDEGIKSRMESIIELVVRKYAFCSDTLALLRVLEMPSGLYERFIATRDSYRSNEMVAKNEIPFFVFEHSIDASESLGMFRMACDEVSNFVDAENSRTYNMLNTQRVRVWNGIWPNRNVDVGFIQEYKLRDSLKEALRNTKQEELLHRISDALSVDEYLNSKEFGTLEELNEIVLEYGLKKPKISIEAVGNEKTITLEWNKQMIEVFVENTPFESIKEEQTEILEAIESVSIKLEDVAKEKDEFSFYSMFKSLKIRHGQIRNRMEDFNRVLRLVELPLIYDELGDKISVLEAEWALFSDLSSSLKVHESQSISNLDVTKFEELIDSIDTSKSHTEYYRVFLNRINNCKKALPYLEDIKRHYVTEKYFDSSMQLKAFLISFDEADVRSRLASSKMEYEVGKYIEKIRWEMDGIRLEVSSSVGDTANEWMVTNLAEIEDKLNEFSAEYDSIVRFNTEAFFSGDVGRIGKSICLYLEVLEDIRRMQKGMVELMSVFGSDILSFEAKKYFSIRGRYSESILKAGITDPTKKSGSIKFKDLLSSKDIFCDINKELNEITRGLRLFLEMCRKETPRLFFVSDEDIVKALGNKLYYTEILRQVFNIDEAIVENECVIGILSNGETLMLRNKVPIDGDIKEFFILFDSILKNTLKSYFLDSLEQDGLSDGSYIPDGCPSVISELVSEFRYFNGRQCIKTLRIRSLEKEVDKYSGDVLKLYPKPMLREDILYMDSISSIRYDFEYYPPTDIVFTSLTSKIFSSICISLVNLSGLILYGRSGTGKTETVRYYCRSIGKPIFVFCCSDGCGLDTLRGIIKGAILTGSYICFDEFNRLDERVMSSATELILSNKDRTKFFLTMNIGYKGRYELPKSLRAIFGEIKVDSPDIKDIIDYYCGDSSDKIFELMSRLEATVDRQEHYDFGLRALKAIVKGTGERHEENNIAKSLTYFYMSSLLEKDKMVFRKSLKDVFGEEINTSLTYLDMLSHGLEAKSGAIIVGGSGVGKSKLIKTLSRDKETLCFYYNPTNISDLFGYSDNLTGEWRDSCFVRDLRGNLHADKEVWFIFDSVIESSWIENFNSILDDNKLLCLSSGERIRIPSHYKFIFECISFNNATPATLTRVFLVHLESKLMSFPGDKSLVSSPEDPTNTEERGISYDGRKTSGFPFTELIPTEELNFYARTVSELAKNRRIIFIRGEAGVGKSSLVSEVFRGNLVVINGGSLNGRNFRNFIDNGKIRTVRGSEVYDTETVFYIEEFNCGGVGLSELVREYNEYGRVGELTMRNVVIICGMDEAVNADITGLDASIERLFMKTASIFMAPPEDSSFVFGEAVRKALKATKHFHDSNKVSEVVLFMYKSLNVSQGKVFAFIKTLGDLCIENYSLPALLYFEVRCHFGECQTVRDEVERVFGMQPEHIEFDLKNRRFIKGRGSNNISIVGSILSRGYNLIIEGPRMSGKHWMLDECMKHIKSDIKIVDCVDEKKISGQTVFLVENGLALGKSIVNKCMLFKLEKPLYYSLDLLKVYHKVSDDYTGPYESILESSLVSDFGVDIDSLLEETFFGSSPLVCSTKKDTQHPSTCNHPTVVTMRCFYKFMDFGKTFIKLVQEFIDKQEKRRKFLCDGMEKIREFKNEAHRLGQESSHKKESLQGFTEELNEKLQKIVYEQGLVEKEKEIVNSKRNGLNKVLTLNLEKRGVIDGKLSSVKVFLEESLKSLAEISKNNLSEIKALVKPPEIVKNTVEAVFYMVESFTDNSTISLQRRQGSRVEWKRLVQFIKSDDFISRVMSCKCIKLSDTLESLILDPSFTYEKAQNASKACGPLFKWVMANYKHAKVLLEIAPLEEEIRMLEGEIEQSMADIDQEEAKLQEFESRISEMKSEYAASSLRLESTRMEISSIDSKVELINKVVIKLSDEAEKWRKMKYLCPIRYILTDAEWMFIYKKNIFVQSIDAVKLNEAKGFISTSLKDRNYRQILSNCSYYGNSVVVSNCNEFDKDVYKLLKHQVRNPTYSVVLASDVSHNFYREYTYLYKAREQFSVAETGMLERLEEELLELMSSYTSLESICAHKELLERERWLCKQDSKKRAVYEVLNSLFYAEEKKFLDAYGMSLSFGIYKEYVEKELYPILVSEFYNKSRGDGMSNDRECKSSDIWNAVVDADMDRIVDILSRNISLFYSKSFPGSVDECADFVSEISKFTFDYTFITPYDDIACAIEDKISITSTISAGSVENNKEICDMLSETAEKCKTYLVKNIHLLNSTKKTGNCRFIFTTEDKEVNSLMRDTRVVYYRANGDYEAIRKGLSAMVGVQDELVDFHAKMVCEYDFCLRDLIVCLKSKEFCDSEYLKVIVYYSRIGA